MERIKYPYAYRLLSDQLLHEERMLGYWVNTLSAKKDEQLIKQAESNKSSAEHRISELKIVLELLK